MRGHKILTITAAVGLLLLTAIIAGLWSLTRPGVTTPLAERALSIATGRDVELLRAWVGYDPWPNLHLRGVSVPDRASLSAADIRPNPFGFLPGVAWVTHANARDGEVIIDHTQRGSQSTDYEDYIDHVELSGIAVTIRRESAVSRFTIVDASGSLGGGDLSLDATAGDGQIFFRGDGKLSLLNSIGGAVTVRGPNLAKVAEALGIAAPDVPPFELNGNLAINPDEWELTGISGHIGDSDIGGELTITFGGDRPFIDTELYTETLDFDDLGVIIGLPSRNENGEALNEAQETANETFATSGRFIPDARVDLERLSVVDAAVKYKAQQVVDAPYAISQLQLDLGLEDRLLTINDVTATMAAGTMQLSGVVNARTTPAQSELDAVFSDMELSTIVPGDVAIGALEGRADLSLTGSDFRTAFGTADGTISFWAEKASIAAIPVEAAGLDLGELFVVYVADGGGSDNWLAAPCAVARLEVTDGVGLAAPFLVDTEDSTLVAEGTISLKDETFDLSLKADAKDASWGSLLGGIDIGGHWRDPEISIEAGGPIAQGIFAALLGSIAGPLAALPFIETGDGKDVPCQELLAQARDAREG